MSMDDKKPASPIKSREDLLKDKKKKIAKKFFWCALSIIGIIILIIGIIFICTSQNDGQSLKKSESEKSAINALKLKLGDTSSLKVLNVSVPDSVFLNRICPEYEIMELSERFLEYSLQIMQDSQDGLFGKENVAYRCMMDRYALSSQSINTLNQMLEKPEGEHCGWRIKIKYQAIDDSDTPYVSEAWFIFDKDKKHILNSFDISIL